VVRRRFSAWEKAVSYPRAEVRPCTTCHHMPLACEYKNGMYGLFCAICYRGERYSLVVQAEGPEEAAEAWWGANFHHYPE